MSRRVAAVVASLLLAAGGAASPGQAQRVDAVSPAGPNSPQRRAILDALRPRIEAVLGGPVEFVVTRMQVQAGWALVIAEPQRPGGGRIDGRRYFPHDFDNMDGLTVSAIMRFRGGRWMLADHAVGATDVWYCAMRGPPRSLTGC